MTTEVLENLGLVIEETPPEAMNLFPLETFAYKYPGKETRVCFTCPEFTAICPFSDFPSAFFLFCWVSSSALRWVL